MLEQLLDSKAEGGQIGYRKTYGPRCCHTVICGQKACWLGRDEWAYPFLPVAQRHDPQWEHRLESVCGRLLAKRVCGKHITQEFLIDRHQPDQH